MVESLACDVLVIGAGPAGLNAAATARMAGADVLLVDSQPLPGGQIWRSADGKQHPEVEALSPELADVSIMHSTTVLDWCGLESIMLLSGTSVYRVAAKAVVIATGARELFLPFPGWTLPGVMGVGGIQALKKSGLEVVGRKIVVAGSGPLLLEVAASLRRSGAQVQAVVEQAPWPKLAKFGLRLLRSRSKLQQALDLRRDIRDVPYKMDTWVTEAEGDTWLRSVKLSDGSSYECHYLATSYGLVPNVELAQLAGCEIVNGFVKVDARGRTSVENVYCAGEPTGIGGVDAAVVEGEIAGYAAAGDFASARALFGKRNRTDAFTRALSDTFALRGELRQVSDSSIVCRCEDVTLSQLKEHKDWRTAKLHTRCGMGPCQGRVCGPAARFLVGWEPGEARAPLFPTSVGALVENARTEATL